MGFNYVAHKQKHQLRARLPKLTHISMCQQGKPQVEAAQQDMEKAGKAVAPIRRVTRQSPDLDPDVAMSDGLPIKPLRRGVSSCLCLSTAKSIDSRLR